ncbi:MAG: glycine betaine/L-proline ABC transporter ATP-binding protein [Rhodobiaceae bacterium]|nr:glycine betaine/L-proline ABC transporter ATP-binding protein [Rhodobiaceae bacterium]MCC0014826.1 glycine betaine/L-proline ABC transporter ATP-binding protein [Rhodobiaceae bacterium]MCC0053168.1 glycine betaine/L-proline ABC transporter ATP-binding protein [Rhodobiaceae bacterium]
MSKPKHKIVIDGVSKVFGPDPQSVMPLVRDGVSKQEMLEKHGHVVGIRDVSLDIPAAGTFVVMGLSGSGKSTLIRHLNRLIDPTAGRILVDGQDILTYNDQQLREFRRSKISMVFQRFALLPHKTVLDNVIYGLVIGGMDAAKAREHGMQQIELVGLSGFENQYPRQLSGGMQQRVGLARALATDAEILLMDEAFSALDPLIRNDMQGQLKELQARLHKTIVFITHDLDEALRLGDNIAILKDGELRQVGTGSEILLKPADDYVSRFVRDVNRARVVTIGSLARKAASLPASDATEARCRELLDKTGAVVLTADGKARAVLDSRDASAASIRKALKAAARGAALPELDAAATIEECFATLAASGGPVITVSANRRSMGLVERGDVFAAMTV